MAYHALTFGWLLDLIVRRADPLKRGIAQFYREEIQKYMDGLFLFDFKNMINDLLIS